MQPVQNLNTFKEIFLTKPRKKYKIMNDKDIYFSSRYCLHGRDLSFQIIKEYFTRNQMLYPLQVLHIFYTAFKVFFMCTEYVKISINKIMMFLNDLSLTYSSFAI